MSPDPPTLRSAARTALLAIALLAILELTLLGCMVASQRDGAHIIDISGAQRMRTQRIAFLAESARTGAAGPRWRNEMLEAVLEMSAVKRELERRSLTRVGPLGADGSMALLRRVEPYLSAARAIVRDPSGAAPLAEIRHDRLPLLGAFDEIVQVRAARLRRQDDRIVAAIAGALAALFAGVILAWRCILVPAERRARDAMTALSESRGQFTSLFYQNPEAIAVYDLRGHIVRGNAAAIELVGYPAEALVGAHFTQHIAPESFAAAAAGFRLAASGRTAIFETKFMRADGVEIDVATSLFPNVAQGKVVGVFGVAKDMRALKRAQAAFEEQSNRIAALYKVASASGRSWRQQIQAALLLACARLGYKGAFLAEVKDGRATLTLGVAHGAVLAVAAPEADLLASVARTLWPEDAARRACCVAAAVTVPVELSGLHYGTLSLLGSERPDAVLSQADTDFLGLVSALVGTSVERGGHEAKLDALAFYDALTGLPNRVLLDDRLSELIRGASRVKSPFAVHYIDLDRFKEVNDRFGHSIGDNVLQIAAKRMQAVLRSTDTVARIGGDEFVILQPTAVDRDSAKDVADRVLAAIARPFIVAGVAHELGASIGISIYPHDGQDGGTLLKRADEALYRAKRNGRNQLRFAA